MFNRECDVGSREAERHTHRGRRYSPLPIVLSGGNGNCGAERSLSWVQLIKNKVRAGQDWSRVWVNGRGPLAFSLLVRMRVGMLLVLMLWYCGCVCVVCVFTRIMVARVFVVVAGADSCLQVCRELDDGRCQDWNTRQASVGIGDDNDSGGRGVREKRERVEGWS